MSTPTLQDGQAGHDAGGSETLGQRLRRAREAQGLKIEAVAEQLRIDATRLMALERDDFSPFPAAVFVRGYLRGCARLFALPDAELIALYERQAVPPAVSLHPLQTTRYDKKTVLITRAGWAIAMLVLFAGAGFWLMQYSLWRDEPPVTSAVAETPAREDATPSAPPLTAATENVPEPLDVSTPTPPQQTAAEPPAAGAAQSVPPAETPVDALVLRFNAESWLEVWDERGKMLAYELAPGGATRRFEQPRLPFRVRLGNSSAVNIEYNGKVFDQSPYARNSVADFVFDKKIAAALQAREDDIVSVTAE